MPEVSISELQQAIRNLHGCEATWIEAVSVKEVFQGEPVWEGMVQVFDLRGHPTANRCYAWSHAVEGSEKRRFVTVLHQGPVDSPQAAVRAAIVQEWHERQERPRKAFPKNIWGQLKAITARELVAALERDGFVLDVGVGTQRTYRHPDGRRIGIHYHTGNKPYGPGLLKSLIEDAGWREDDLRRVKLVK